jgi:protein-tyrosine phosphatase
MRRMSLISNPSSRLPEEQDQMPVASHRELTFEGLPNVRDLGGITLGSDLGVVDCGKVLRSASPQFLSPQGAKQLIEYGVKTVIDLRTPEETAVEGSGPMSEHYESGLIKHLPVPILSERQRATDPVGTANALVDPAHHYINYLANPAPFVMIARAVLETSSRGGAVLLHCALGKDRTGVSAAVLLDAAGAVHHEVVEDYAITRRHMRTMVEGLASSVSYRRDFTTPDWSALAPQPEGIAGMLSWVKQNYGNAGHFLLSGGLTETELGALRSALRYSPE